jgi:hypothetical protein
MIAAAATPVASPRERFINAIRSSSDDVL